MEWSKANEIKLNMKKDKSAVVPIFRRGRRPKSLPTISKDLIRQDDYTYLGTKI